MATQLVIFCDCVGSTTRAAGPHAVPQYVRGETNAFDAAAAHQQFERVSFMHVCRADAAG